MTCVFILIGVIFGVAATWFLLTYKYNYRRVTLALQNLENSDTENKEFCFRATRDIAFLKEQVKALTKSNK